MSSMLFFAQRLCQYGITALNSFSEHQALALAYMEVTSTVLLHGPVEYEPYEPLPWPRFARLTLRCHEPWVCVPEVELEDSMEVESGDPCVCPSEEDSDISVEEESDDPWVCAAEEDSEDSAEEDTDDPCEWVSDVWVEEESDDSDEEDEEPPWEWELLVADWTVTLPSKVYADKLVYIE